MSLFLFILAALAMTGVVVVLGIGFYSLFKGGSFGATWSNKLMRLRVLLQAVSIVLLVALAWAWGHGH